LKVFSLYGSVLGEKPMGQDDVAKTPVIESQAYKEEKYKSRQL